MNWARFLLTALILFVALVWITAHDHHQKEQSEADLRQIERRSRIEIVCAAKHPRDGFDGCVAELMVSDIVQFTEDND